MAVGVAGWKRENANKTCHNLRIMCYIYSFNNMEGVMQIFKMLSYPKHKSVWTNSLTVYYSQLHCATFSHRERGHSFNLRGPSPRGRWPDCHWGSWCVWIPTDRSPVGRAPRSPAPDNYHRRNAATPTDTRNTSTLTVMCHGLSAEPHWTVRH